IVVSSTSCPTLFSNSCLICATVVSSPFFARSKNGVSSSFSSSNVRYSFLLPPFPGVSTDKCGAALVILAIALSFRSWFPLFRILPQTASWYQMVQEGISLRKRIRALGSWLFSWFLFLLAGYGYRPLRSFLAYLLVIAGFATAYYIFSLNDLVGPHYVPGPHYLSWYEAFVVSMTAFHGRGFFVGTFSPGDPQALVAAIEAFLGLLIEVTFIATLTQRLFSR